MHRYFPYFRQFTNYGWASTAKRLLLICGLAVASCAMAGESLTGLVIVKSHPWSPNTEISEVIPYRSYDDHTGYYTVYQPNGSKVDVRTDTIVELYIPPSIGNYHSLTNDAEYQQLAGALNDLLAKGTKISRLGTLLARTTSLFQNEANLYVRGNRKVNGVWMPEAKYRNALAEAAAARASAEEQRAKAEQEQRLNELRRAAMAEREAIIASMEKEADLSKAEAIAVKLGSMATNPEVAEALRRWQNDKQSVLKWKIDARLFLDKLDENRTAPLFKTFKGVDDVESFPSQTEAKAASLEGGLEKVRSGLRFPSAIQSISSESSQVLAVVETDSVVRAIKRSDLMGAESILAARLHQLAPPPTSIAGLFSAIHAMLTQSIAAGYDHQRKAEALEKLGKTSEAIKEYQQAYDATKTKPY